ncbi:MAG: hypothetical protein AAF497_22620, partial [Planctomycetota bacterium]
MDSSDFDEVLRLGDKGNSITKRILTYLVVGLLAVGAWFAAFWAMGYTEPVNPNVKRQQEARRKHGTRPSIAIKRLLLTDISNLQLPPTLKFIDTKLIPRELSTTALMEIVNKEASRTKLDYAVCLLSTEREAVEGFTLHPDLQLQSSGFRFESPQRVRSMLNSELGRADRMAYRSNSKTKRPLTAVRIACSLPQSPRLEQLNRFLPELLNGTTGLRCERVVGSAPLTLQENDHVYTFHCNVTESKKEGTWDATATLVDRDGEEAGKESLTSASSTQLGAFFVETLKPWLLGSNPKLVEVAGKLDDSREDISNGWVHQVQRNQWSGQLKELALAEQAFLLAPENPDTHNAVLTSIAARVKRELTRGGVDDYPAFLDYLDQYSNRSLEFIKSRLADETVDWGECLILLPNLGLSLIPQEHREYVRPRVQSQRREIRLAIVEALEARQDRPREMETLFLRGLRWLNRSPDWYGESLEQSAEFRRNLLKVAKGIDAEDYLVESLLLSGMRGRTNRAQSAQLANELEMASIAPGVVISGSFRFSNALDTTPLTSGAVSGSF